MVYRVRKQLVEEGLEAVLSRRAPASPAVPRIFDGEEARLIALAQAARRLCALEPATAGGNKVVEFGIVEAASDSTISGSTKTRSGRTAANTGSSRPRPAARS